MSAIIDSLRTFKEEGKVLSVKNHIRPAMSYLNAVGGSVVIDCLSKEEITNIFCDAIDAIMQGDTPSLNLDAGIEEDEDDVDVLDEDDIISEDETVAEVVLGCKIVIRNEENETKTYKYDLIRGVLPKALEVFTGHKVGDLVEMSGSKWKIEDVIL